MTRAEKLADLIEQGMLVLSYWDRSQSAAVECELTDAERKMIIRALRLHRPQDRA